MTGKIFRAILSASILVLIASLSIISAVMYQYFARVQEAQLKDELSLAAKATQGLGKEYLENLGFERYRLTWVSSDGRVIFESHAEASTMENHGDREEIREALVSGTGSSTRQSSTLAEKTIYEATRLDDGSVLRISVSRASALALVFGMLRPIAAVLIIAIVLSSLLARHMANWVVEPLNRLDLDNPLENKAYEELSPLLRRIHAQHTEIQQQMHILKQKQDEFEQITGSMKEALVLLDSTGRILSINPAAGTLFGVTAACLGEDFLTIDRKENMRHALEETATQGHAVFRAKKNGRDFQFELSRIDSDGAHRGTVILAFDISEQVNAEKHRQEFTANVSHELRTPLQSIIGSAELMENGIVKADEIPRFVGHIRKEASRLVFLIDDIIRLSELDENAEMSFDDVSLRSLSEEVCASLADAAKLKDVSLEAGGDEGIVKGVRRLLYEIVYNLCDNAVKYNKPGGSVKVTVSEKRGKVLLSVHDTGIGIAPEHQGKIFERFYRVDKSHSKQSGGTGLGLSIVKHAVKYHHGKIELESQPDKGTTISVMFDAGK